MTLPLPRFCRDIEQMQDGFGDKMGTFVQWFATFIGGYALAFAISWKLVLVTLSLTPIMVIVVTVLGRVRLFLASSFNIFLIV